MHFIRYKIYSFGMHALLSALSNNMVSASILCILYAMIGEHVQAGN